MKALNIEHRNVQQLRPPRYIRIRYRLEVVGWTVLVTPFLGNPKLNEMVEKLSVTKTLSRTGHKSKISFYFHLQESKMRLNYTPAILCALYATGHTVIMYHSHHAVQKYPK